MLKRRTLGNLEVALPADPPRSGEQMVDRQRRLLAGLCKSLSPTPAPPSDGLTALVNTFTPRQRQTLERLIAGDSEKQIARRLGVSPNTVHVYVKSLYRALNVNSRGELMARFVNPPWSGATRND